MTIEQLIFNYSRQTPQKIALIQGEIEVTYHQLWTEITKAASWFGAHATAGDRVLLSASKNVEFVYTYFGAHLAGLICVPIDIDTNETRLKRIVNLAQPKLAVGELTSHMLEVIPFNECKNTPTLPIGFPAVDTVADIIFTTGTTGLPKGVVLTYENELAAASNINTFIGNEANDVELLALPISHSFGLGRLRCVLAKGATLVLLGSFASMKKFYGELERCNVTGFGMAPASWAYITKMSGDRIAQFSHQLRYIEIGSAYLPLHARTKLMSLLPSTRLCLHYGLTEASRCAFINFNDDVEHMMSEGKPLPETEVAIFNEQGEPLPKNVDGEICVKGRHVCSGYWGMTEEEFRLDFFGDYLRTGDWGHIDSDGYVHLVSRNKDIINVGGKKVGPIEVEEQLNEIDGIVESACVGVHDDVFGEVVKAFCVCSKEVNFELAKKALFKKLETYKIPVYFERISELPKTQSGKILRLALKTDNLTK